MVRFIIAKRTSCRSCRGTRGPIDTYIKVISQSFPHKVDTTLCMGSAEISWYGMIALVQRDRVFIDFTNGSSCRKGQPKPLI